MVKVNFNRLVQLNQNFELCEGDYIKIFNKFYKRDTSFVHSLGKLGSCDTMININLVTKKSALVSKNYSICQGEEILLNNKVISKDTSFQYIIKGGCDTTFNIKVIVVPPLKINKMFELCNGDSVKIFSKWYKADLYDTIYINHSGSPSAECDSIVYIQTIPAKGILIEGLDVVEVPQGGAYFPKSNLSVMGPTNITYQWSLTNALNKLTCNGCSNPSITVLKNDTIKLNVIDPNGCKSNKSIQLRVKSCDNLFIPNVFTPNDDNINDWFFPSSDDCIKEINLMEVFDRWGDLIFRQEHFQPNMPTAGWDGKFKGTVLQPAVFVYRVVIESSLGIKGIYKGDITLIG